jgi:hypothetical protein
MSRARVILLWSALLLVVAGHAMAQRESAGSRRSSLTTIEGRIDAVETVPGEGGVDALAVRVVLDEPEPRDLQILLAPEKALAEIGFEVQEGDRLRARIFLAEDGPAPAQRVMNMTRGTIVRLRTLTRIPVWSSAGQWQGGACRNGRGWEAGGTPPGRRGGGGRR